MKDLGLLLSNLGQKKIRTGLLAFATLVGFLVYGSLTGFEDTTDAFLDNFPADQLQVNHRDGFIRSLPLAYENRIRALDDVVEVSYSNWFGSYIGEERDQRPAFAVSPETYFLVDDDIAVAPEVVEKFKARRDAIIMPDRYMEEFGWEVGEQVTIPSNIFPNKSTGSNSWPFTIVGTWETDPDVRFIPMYINWEYFNEARQFGTDTVGAFQVIVSSPDKADLVAEAIDIEFSNSSAQTETVLESQFVSQFFSQALSITILVRWVSIAGFVTILLIVGNSMVVAIRERTKEIAVMKTLGFRGPRIFRLVLGESMSLCLLGGLAGLGLTYLLYWAFNTFIRDGLSFAAPALGLGTDTVLIGVAIAFALGLVTGLVPAMNAFRLNIVRALGRV